MALAPLPITALLLLFLIFSEADDGSVMAKLASSISPPPASWTGTDFCNWSGVDCSNGRVTSINLFNKSLAGTLPSNLNSLSQLITLSLQGNRFSGELPSFSNLANLQQLYLDNNNFSSIAAATAFSGLSSLQIISLSSNPNFPPWPFPSELTQSTELTTLRAASCNLFGSIPDIFDSFANLSDLQLGYNSLTGVVPQSLTSSPNLVNVSLIDNNLQGPYPAFKSGVKAEIGTANNFCTDRPGAACDAQVTALIAVAGAFGYPIKLAEVWRGNNACNQWMFISCDSYGNITSVDLAKQDLNGSISPDFAKLTHLRNLNLNDNNLNGSIPESLTTLTNLQALDVSNNNLSGQVPEFRTGVTVNYNGNPFIGNSNSDGGVRSGKSSISVGLVIGLVIGVVLLVGIMVLVFCKCYLRKGGSKSGDHNEMLVSESGGGVVISIQVLKQVTNNFSDENILGKGGFGVVYKGELRDGTKVAVKRIHDNEGMNEFHAEIDVLTKAKHRHLVALYGYCINGDEKILVYEYMSQGTLAQHLFEWRGLGFRPLTWKERVTIALDVARGVEYLHSLAQSSFVHRDLKPTNILLGDDMRAKVGDFGLVKNFSDGDSSTWTRVAGTYGYLAPEYGATGRVSTKVDVYSFGVILMELITGRKALDNSMPEESCHLVTWFRCRIVMNMDNIRNAIDDVLDLDDEAYECILKVAELARHCTSDKSNQRPDIGHAVNILAPLVKQWIPTSPEEESFGWY